MKILNLTNNETSDIKFEVSKFPDGQQNIIIDNSGTNQFMLYEDYDFSENYRRSDIQIKSRLNNFLDLELIICATKALRNLGVKEIHLFTPYMLGSRSDRLFSQGSTSYIKDVIAPIINSLNFESVTVIDPHSDVLEACLDNYKKIDNLNLINFTISNIYKNQLNAGGVSYTSITEKNGKFINNNFILISPDAGANKKVFKVAEQIGYTGDIITCSKSRDVDGNLTKVNVPIQNYENKDLIIIDDICDGGATFINIAKEFKKIPTCKIGKIYLIVTHGIFSKGTENLKKYFDGIYCTNSYSDFNDQPFIKADIEQLNVF